MRIGLEVPWSAGDDYAPQRHKGNWIPAVEEADAMPVWGGYVLYLRPWMRESGLAKVLSSLWLELVYVGVSAGSMVTTSWIGETYTSSQPLKGDDIKTEVVIADTPQGTRPRVDLLRNLQTFRRKSGLA